MKKPAFIAQAFVFEIHFTLASQKRMPSKAQTDNATRDKFGFRSQNSLGEPLETFFRIKTHVRRISTVVPVFEIAIVRINESHDRKKAFGPNERFQFFKTFSGRTKMFDHFGASHKIIRLMEWTPVGPEVEIIKTHLVATSIQHFVEGWAVAATEI